MNATAMMISAMPSGGIGSLSRPVPEPQKQAGLLLSDRSFSGRKSRIFSIPVAQRKTVCVMESYFVPRGPVVVLSWFFL